MDDDALMAKLMAAFDDDAAPDQAGDEPRPSEQPFDTQRFLAGLDAIFDAHAAAKAGPYLEQAMIDAENAGDDAGLLTVLNETMGFYRSQGRHKENQWIVQRALELATRMGITGTEAWTTTLINAATAMRAAGQYDQSEDLYKQAQASSERTLAPSDRRLAALHNNLSVLYSETGKTHQAEVELGEALRILESSSPDAETDLDVASTHTNLALTLLAEDKLSAASWHAAKALEIYASKHSGAHAYQRCAEPVTRVFHQHEIRAGRKLREPSSNATARHTDRLPSTSGGSVEEAFRAPSLQMTLAGAQCGMGFRLGARFPPAPSRHFAAPLPDHHAARMAHRPPPSTRPEGSRGDRGPRSLAELDDAYLLRAIMHFRACSRSRRDRAIRRARPAELLIAPSSFMGIARAPPARVGARRKRASARQAFFRVDRYVKHQ